VDAGPGAVQVAIVHTNSATRPASRRWGNLSTVHGAASRFSNVGRAAGHAPGRSCHFRRHVSACPSDRYRTPDRYHRV